jgi:hypothetical protein
VTAAGDFTYVELLAATGVDLVPAGVTAMILLLAGVTLAGARRRA